MLQIQNRSDDEECARYLSGAHLDLVETSIPWILNHIDCFVSQCRGNESVENVILFPYPVIGQDYEAWGKLGGVIGNLQALDRLRISTHNYLDESDYSDEDDDEGAPPVPILDWEILARILRHVRQKITIDITDVQA
jgi:hypothetical protein